MMPRSRPRSGVRPAVRATKRRLRWAGALVLLLVVGRAEAQSPTINGHPVVRDSQQKIITWMTPAATAFDRFLDKRWDFIKNRVPLSPGPPPRSDYPLYYFFNGYPTTESTIEPDWWMNDVGEKIPNWFESARLYYAYTGDSSVMDIATGLVDYAIAHGTSPPTFDWPNFPYTTTNAGDTEFRGFTEGGRFRLHEIQVDHAGEMGLTYYRMYLYTGDPKYLGAAQNVADVLAAKARTGTATRSVWPYRVVMDSGNVTAQYGANWIGSYALLDALVQAGIGNVDAYRAARDKARAFILDFPMETGYWTDGHTDTPIDSNTYRSNLSKSNAALYILDNPGFDPDWQTHIPELIQWTETYFVNRTVGGEPATDWGANIVGEQDSFLYKMDYQTARYAAENALWYAASGDAAAREKAFRALSWVTYTNDADGRATESPYSTEIATWWSDCYGEAPRMFYHVFAAIPEWAPPGEDHILYSQGVLRDVSYAPGLVDYETTSPEGTEYLRLTFPPAAVTVDGSPLSLRGDLDAEGYTQRDLGGGDYAVTIRRARAGHVVVSATDIEPPGPTLAIDPWAVPAAVVGSPYSQKFTQSGGVGTLTWGFGGSLPAGLSFAPSTSTLSGVPGATGSFPFTVTVADSAGGSGSADYTLLVGPDGPFEAVALDVDLPGGNGVLEPGEAVTLAPSWRKTTGGSEALTGILTDFSGPGSLGPFYSIRDDAAAYGLVGTGAAVSCAVATGDCYRLEISVPTSRPATHWDALAREEVPSSSPSASRQIKDWVVHVGGSFDDVPRTSPFYRHIETLLHRGVTAGCSATSYCPTGSTTRAQMAVFVLKAKEGPEYRPPSCGGGLTFADVPTSSPFCPWIGELARREVVSGCGGDRYCPDQPVTREQMAVFVLKTLDSTLAPPACTTPVFVDVPATSMFCRWVEELYRREVVVGCAAGRYCPTSPVSREQMGVFIGTGFDLALYGP